jgi:hypothetical protein
MKSGMQTSFFLASYAFRNKVLVIVKKIWDPRSGIQKQIHPGSGSATLEVNAVLLNFCNWKQRGFYKGMGWLVGDNGSATPLLYLLGNGHSLRQIAKYVPLPFFPTK